MNFQQSKLFTIIGNLLTGLAGLFFAMDGIMKVLRVPQAVEITAQLGWPPAMVPTLGIILLLGAIIYLWPKTSVLGAIILTGYLGGAVAAHARLEAPLFSHTLFGVYIGVIMWGGLFFRDGKLRALLPWRAKD